MGRDSTVKRRGRPGFLDWSRRSDGGLGEGHAEVVVLSQVVVVELNQGLDGLLHCGHLDQGHLAVFPRVGEHRS